MFPCLLTRYSTVHKHSKCNVLSKSLDGVPQVTRPHQKYRIAALLIGGIFTFTSAANEPAALELHSRIDHLDTLAREPMITQHPGGALFVSGYPSQVTGTDWTVPPLLWRSDDDGEAWERINVGTSASGAQGNSDIDLSVGPDGALYLVSMGFNRETKQGTHIAMGVSASAGKSWDWQFLSQNRLDDRPWIVVGSDAVAHAVWNGSAGVRYTRSKDRGQSWSAPQSIAMRGGSSHLAVGEDGRLAVRVSPIGASANTFDEEADYLLVSADNGATWTQRALPGRITWDPTFADPTAVPRWVEPIAWTDDGVLHHIWSEGTELKYGYSGDLGKTWSTRTISESTGIAFYPFLSSNGTDKLALTWFVKDEASLSARVAQLTRAPTWDSPQVLTAEPFYPDAWDETTEHRNPTAGGEYIPVKFLAGGDLAVVTPIQNIHDNRWGFSFWRFQVRP